MKAQAKQTDLLQDAHTLADFSNLKPEEVDYFQHNYAEFVPKGLWGTETFAPVTGARHRVWELEQGRLRDAWHNGFPPETCVELVTSLAKMSDIEQMLETISNQMGKMENEEIRNFLAGVELPKREVWPYQRAVMFLSAAPWRARFCSQCGKRFVIDKPKQGLCSELCRQQAARTRKRAWANRSRAGKKQRGKRSKVKAGAI